MPNKCCVPGCKGNYDAEHTRHMFRFPKDEELCKKWLRVLHRDKFQPTQYSRVCDVHFAKENIIWVSTYFDEKTGKTLQVPLKYPKLQQSSIPVNFPNCPSYISKSIPVSRKSRDEKKIEIEQQNLSLAIQKSIDEFSAYQKTITFQNFQEFLPIFNAMVLPNDWLKSVNTQNDIVLYKLKYSPAPIITYSVIINQNLTLETYLYGQDIVLQINKFKTPFTISNINDLSDLLNEINKLNSEHQIENNNEINSDEKTNIINQICNMLESIKCENFNKTLSFICEQLKLLILPKERYRYSPDTIIFCSILNTISSHSYRYLRGFGHLTLPHPDSLKNICNSFLSDPCVEERQSFLTYAKSAFKYVKENETFMILLMDEIHIKPYLDYKGGNIVGTAINSSTLANSAFTFMLNGLCSNFKEVVHIAPISKINHELLFSFIKSIIVGLEDIGFKIFCVISDNNAINSKAMSNFCKKKQLSIVYPHPVNNKRPLFYLFDSVHLLKCIKNNWMNVKPNQIFTFPDFDNFDLKYASFQALIELHNTENNKLLKHGYSLTLKSLFPTNFEKQNVTLALKIFNPFVIQALLTFGSKIKNSHDTATFLNIILTWWKIVNVKTPYKGKRLNDIYQDPITYNSLKSNDPKIKFLNQMLLWLEAWKNSKTFSTNLTNQTHTALHHTIYGMLEVITYCFEELKMKYVLLGKFQTDPLENRFGKYRQMAGGQYNISIRQLYESEKKLRIQSLMSLKSTCFGPVKIDSFYDNDEGNETDNTTCVTENQLGWFNPIISITEHDIANVKEEMPVIAYLGGYCCYILLKKSKCDICKENLTFKDDLQIDDNHTLIKNLTRGCLKFPKDYISNIVLYEYIIFNKILENSEEDFLAIHNKKTFLATTTLEYLKNNNFLGSFPKCQMHNSETNVKIIINSVTNTLLKNYCGKKNDRIGKGNKRKLDTLTS